MRITVEKHNHSSKVSLFKWKLQSIHSSHQLGTLSQPEEEQKFNCIIKKKICLVVTSQTIQLPYYVKRKKKLCNEHIGLFRMLKIKTNRSNALKVERLWRWGGKENSKRTSEEAEWQHDKWWKCEHWLVCNCTDLFWWWVTDDEPWKLPRAFSLDARQETPLKMVFQKKKKKEKHL